jgi:membrane protein DedA with SNARE-associated domain
MIAWLTGLPPLLVYLVLGLGAALENVVPVIPADTFVILGGFIAAQGRADPVAVFFATWGGNVATALIVYGLAWRHGPQFFSGGSGRRLLKPRQLHRLAVFYRRWGPGAIFLTRFLPGFRAVVPVFAGVTHQRFLPVAVPLAAASALWYGLLTWAGTIAGQNLDAILEWIGQLNRGLLVVSALLGVAIAVWWRRSHREVDSPEELPGSPLEETKTQ